MARQSAPQPVRAPRERILATASELFYEHGLRGVGIDRIIAESGVAKATLYAHFPSKDELAAEYLRRRDEFWSGRLHAAAAAAGDDPRDQLLGIFDAVSAACAFHGFRGCAFVNAMSESEPGSAPHAAATAHKAAVRGWVRDLAEAAGAREPEVLARQLTLLVDGALVGGRFEEDPSALAASAARAAASLVDAACSRR